MYGKAIRMAQLYSHNSDKICIIPMDHGVTLGPIAGLDNYTSTIEKILKGNADAIILHKGLLKRIANFPQLVKGRYIMHLSASTDLGLEPDYKVLVASVEEAIKLGALGVSMQIDLQSDHEKKMLYELGQVSKICMEWGIPLLVMIYLSKQDKDNSHIVHAVRVAEELGADMVKIAYPETIGELRRVTSCVSIPVLVAGGQCEESYTKFLVKVKDWMDAGAGGVAIGRYAFQSSNPEIFTNLIVKLVNGQCSLNDCINKINEESITFL